MPAGSPFTAPLPFPEAETPSSTRSAMAVSTKMP